MERDVALQTADIFEKAASYIRKHGWQVTGMGVHGGPRCSMGALASAHPQRIWNRHLSQYMYAKLSEELDGIGLTEFNYKHRDGEKVAELFENLATKLRHEQASVVLL